MFGRPNEVADELRRKAYVALRALLQRYLTKAEQAGWFGEMSERQKEWRANSRE